MNLFEGVSGLAVRYLKPQRFASLRAQYLSARTKLHPMLRIAYGTFDTPALREHLERRIGTDFEILMVHSSVNNMAPMYTGNPLDLVRMLMAFCGPERTLAMPAFYFGDQALGGAFQTFRQQPRFDLKRTPSQMGLATEIFRRTKGVRQSCHPVYRVSALGPLAEALTRGHEQAGSPCGRGTPFDFMANHHTWIIGIGKPLEVLTQVHHAEDLMGEEFPVPGEVGAGLQMTLVNGQEEIPFTLTQRSLRWRRNMWKLRAIMGPDKLREWKFHHVPMFATRAGDVTGALIDAATRGVTLFERA